MVENDNVINYEIRQGCDWSAEITLQNDDESAFDMTGCSFRGQARANHFSDVVAFTFVFTPSLPLSAGILVVSLPNTFYTSKMNGPARFVYDFEMVDGGGLVHPLGRGTVLVHPEATKL